MSATDEVTRAYDLVNAVLQPLMRKGGKGEVEAARVAYGQLNLLKQWARAGAGMHEAAEAQTQKLKVKKRRG